MTQLEGHVNYKTVPLTAQAIADLDDQWYDLAAGAVEKNVYFFPWFIQASLGLYKNKQPTLLSIYYDDLLIGLLTYEDSFGYAKLPIGFYRTALHPHQFTGTPLIRDGYAQSFAAGLGLWIDAAPQSRSFCQLLQLNGEEEIVSALEERFTAEKRAFAFLERNERAAILTPQGPAQISHSHISKSRLKSIKRRRKNLEKLGSVSIETLSKDDDIQIWFDDFLRVENCGWKNELGTSIQENPADIEFYREMLGDAQKNNCVNFFRLCLDGKAIAYTLDILSGPFSYCLKCGHDFEYRKYAPGVLLELETLDYYVSNGEENIVDSCTHFDNTMLNDLWPDRKKIVSLGIAKKQIHHKILFNIMSRFNTLIK